MRISRRHGLLALASVALAACTSTLPATGSSGASSASGGGSSPSSSGSGGASTSSGGASTASSGAGGAAALRVLFVGNSYTYVNDLPGWVHKLAVSSGAASVAVDSSTLGGATLMDHATTTGAVDRIREGGWTHVVLQGQSVEPLLDPATFEAGAAALVAEVKKVGAEPVFYETWARKAGDVVYQQPWSGGTPAAMQAGLRAEYQKVAVASGVNAPAGDAWEKALAKPPAIGLFQSDGSHPSAAGTYLVACVFHAALTGHSPVGIVDHPAEISAEEAAALQQLAAAAVAPAP